MNYIKRKKKNDSLKKKRLKKRMVNVSHPLFPRKRIKKKKKNQDECFCSVSNEKKREKSTSGRGYWFYVNTSFFVIYSAIQAAKVLIAVCHSFLI